MTKHLVGCPDFNHIDMRRIGSDNLLPSYDNSAGTGANGTEGEKKAAK